MKIVLYGARGRLGQRILTEALARGHQVTAVVRKPELFEEPHPGIEVIKGDVTDPASVAAVTAGSDVVISAIGPSPKQPPEIIEEAARSLIAGMQKSGAKRLVIVGGAGSLQAAQGIMVMDTPEFPPSWRPVAQAHKNALDIVRAAPLDWTYISPAAMIQPGERTAHFRTGLDDLLVDGSGQSNISIEDFAVALLNEVEKPAHIRQRFTVAY